MPREQITREPVTPNPDGPGFLESLRRHLHIGWNKIGGLDGHEGWVQLSMDVTVSELKAMLVSAEQEAQAEWAKTERMAQDALDQPGGAVIETMDRVSFILGHRFRVVGEVLTRSEVNRLVQLARKARDDAYGRDA